MPYINQTEIGILAGAGIVPSFSAQLFNGVKINKWKLEAGLTTGVDDYSEITVLPLAAKFIWNPFNTHCLSPFISLTTGYGFDWLQRKSENRWYSGGYMINPSMGLRIKTTNAARVNLCIGFRQQNASMYQASDPFEQISVTKDQYTFNRLSLSMGISF